MGLSLFADSEKPGGVPCKSYIFASCNFCCREIAAAHAAAFGRWWMARVQPRGDLLLAGHESFVNNRG